MEQFNSGELKENHQKYFPYCPLIGLVGSGRKVWQEEEETRTYSSTVLMLQEQWCISELFKNIQDAVLLILHYKTMSFFRTVSSSTFVTSDVQ